MCVFCRIIDGEVPASVVFEDDQTIAFLDIQPVTPGHVLVVPKKHEESFQKLPAEDACHMIKVGQLIDHALWQSGLQCEGVQLFLADGKAAGQDVSHVHLHVFPRFEGDEFVSRFQPGPRKEPGRQELDAVAEKIRAALKK